MTVYTNQNIVKKLITFHNQHFNQTMNSTEGYNSPMATGSNQTTQYPVRGSNQWTEANHRLLLEQIERTASPPSPKPPQPFYLSGNFDTHPFEEKKINELINALDNIMLQRSRDAVNTKYEI